MSILPKLIPLDRVKRLNTQRLINYKTRILKHLSWLEHKAPYYNSDVTDGLEGWTTRVKEYYVMLKDELSRREHVEREHGKR